MVSQLEATTTTYPVPTASISGVSALKGKTVYYIPLVAVHPRFRRHRGDDEDRAGQGGHEASDLQRQGQPSTVASCVQQATAADAAGIITDAIPYAMAQNALDAAKAKGIPIIIADQIPPSAPPNTDAGDLRARRDRPAEPDRLVDDRQLAGQGERDHRAGVRLALVDRVRADSLSDLQAVLPGLHHHGQEHHRHHQQRSSRRTPAPTC